MEHLTFERCYEAATIIAEKICCASASYNGIYGIPKGGWIPAAMIAYQLILPLVNKPARNILIVDDCINTGKALRQYYCQDYDLAVLQVHEKNVNKCRFYGLMINDFVEFPWEIKEWNL